MDLLSACPNHIVRLKSEDKPKYHAAAVFASNLAVGLINQAKRLLMECGFDEDAALKALKPLTVTNMNNIFDVGTCDALTGPVERHDIKTVQKHLNALDQETKETYSALTKEIINGEKITMLTAYDYSTAKLFDEAGIDTMLVGDSLGMVMLGYDSTIPVTVDDMIHHGAAVVRGAKNAMIVVDMPFLSYHTSVYDAVANAGRIMKETGCTAVKLEGGKNVCPQIEAIVNAQIPVCAHIGLTPQSSNMFGGFRVQGKSEEAAKELIEAAQAVEKAGAFMLVLEGIPEKLAAIITKKVHIPTIGIGASAECDGQVLVYQDMLAMYGNFVPKFVKQFAQVGEVMQGAVKDYINAVKEGIFPGPENTYAISDDVIEKLY